MNTDDLKNAWQSQLSGRRLVFDEDVILRQVVRGQSDLRGMLFWRDVREIGVAIILVGVFVCFYFTLGEEWPHLLIAASLAWVAGFMLVDRIRHRKRWPHREDTIKACAESTLAEINHQIRLLNSVLWWYILPPVAAMEISFVNAAVRMGELWGFLAMQLLLLVVTIGVYFLNRWAVRAYLEPRRQEMEALLRNLEAE